MNRIPNANQLNSLYRICYQLIYTCVQPIHLVWVDDRTYNIYVMAGYDDELEFQVLTNGEIADESD